MLYRSVERSLRTEPPDDLVYERMMFLIEFGPRAQTAAQRGL